MKQLEVFRGEFTFTVEDPRPPFPHYEFNNGETYITVRKTYFAGWCVEIVGAVVGKTKDNYRIFYDNTGRGKHIQRLIKNYL